MRDVVDDQVLDFKTWCQMNSISPATGQRILSSGNGPALTWLSPRRRGITVGNNRRWQESRTKAPAPKNGG
jgi:hypothetical protein